MRSVGGLMGAKEIAEEVKRDIAAAQESVPPPAAPPPAPSAPSAAPGNDNVSADTGVAGKDEAARPKKGLQAAGGKKSKKGEGVSRAPAADLIGGLKIFADGDVSAPPSARGLSADAARRGALSVRSGNSSVRTPRDSSAPPLSARREGRVDKKVKGGGDKKAKGGGSAPPPIDKENAAPQFGQFDMRTLVNGKKAAGGQKGGSPRHSPRLSARGGSSPMVAQAPKALSIRA